MLPTIGPWLKSDPKVEEWYNALEKRAKNTALNYARLLSLYWNHNTRFRTFPSTEPWLNEVNEQQGSSQVITRRAWGKELQKFFWEYHGKNGRQLASKSQNNLRAAVLHFLTYHRGETESFEFTLGTQEQVKEEAKNREAETPPSKEDVKLMYGQCRTTRDRALLSTLIHGFALSEWLDFASSWHKYKADIEKGTVPLRVDIPYRSKTLRKNRVDSYTLLFDDAVEDLQTLYNERKRQIGRELTESDLLFTTNDGSRPLNVNLIEILFRELARRAGLFKRIGKLHRLRPHKMGRTFFATEAANAEVSDAVREFVLMHKTDGFGGAYVQFHKTKKGQATIERELRKMRQILNFRSDKGNEPGTVAVEDMMTIMKLLDDMRQHIGLEDLAWFGRHNTEYWELREKYLKDHPANQLLDKS